MNRRGFIGFLGLGSVAALLGLKTLTDPKPVEVIEPEFVFPNEPRIPPSLNTVGWTGSFIAFDFGNGADFSKHVVVSVENGRIVAVTEATDYHDLQEHRRRSTVRVGFPDRKSE